MPSEPDRLLLRTDASVSVTVVMLDNGGYSLTNNWVVCVCLTLSCSSLKPGISHAAPNQSPVRPVFLRVPVIVLR